MGNQIPASAARRDQTADSAEGKSNANEDMRDDFEAPANVRKGIDEELPADAGDRGELARMSGERVSSATRVPAPAARTAHNAKENLLEGELFAGLVGG